MLLKIAASFCITVPKPDSTASQHCLAQQPSPGSALLCDMLLQNHAGVHSTDVQTGTMSIVEHALGFLKRTAPHQACVQRPPSLACKRLNR